MKDGIELCAKMIIRTHEEGNYREIDVYEGKMTT